MADHQSSISEMGIAVTFPGCRLSFFNGKETLGFGIKSETPMSLSIFIIQQKPGDVNSVK